MQKITFVTDRPGHDRRYAIDATKIHHELGWKPSETFETGIRKMIHWYLDKRDWVINVASEDCKKRIESHLLYYAYLRPNAAFGCLAHT